jgi:hypothetical protein
MVSSSIFESDNRGADTRDTWIKSGYSVGAERRTTSFTCIRLQTLKYQHSKLTGAKTALGVTRHCS